MAGPYTILLLLVVLTSTIGWLFTRRRVGAAVGGASLPSPGLFSFTATASLLALAIGIVIAWAPSVTAVHCTEAMMTAGRCRASSLTGASGLMLFLFPLGVALAYLWGEGVLSPSEPASAPEPAPPRPSASPSADAGSVSTEPAAPAIPDPRLSTAIVDGTATGLNAAVEAAAERLRDKQIALVFSGAVSKHANDALDQLAQALDAPRFIVADDGPHGEDARQAAGERASHADELALALAGGLYQGVLLIDARTDFHELTLMSLGMLASVCLAEEPTQASDACAIVLPAASEEEAERARAGDELAGDRRPRAYLLTLLRRSLAPGWTPPAPEDDEAP